MKQLLILKDSRRFLKILPEYDVRDFKKTCPVLGQNGICGEFDPFLESISPKNIYLL